MSEERTLYGFCMQPRVLHISARTLWNERCLLFRFRNHVCVTRHQGLGPSRFGLVNAEADGPHEKFTKSRIPSNLRKLECSARTNLFDRLADVAG